MLGSLNLRPAVRRSPLSLAITLALLIALAVFLVVTVRATYTGHRFRDFGIFYAAGRAVLHGESPYPQATADVLRHQNQFVYPAFSAVVMAPLALLPLHLAAAVLMCCSFAGLIGALWLCGVRDWRCGAVCLLSVAVAQGIVLGAITPLLALALAVAWRWRDRPWVAASALACAIVAKLLVAPLLVWLLITRRFAAAALTLALSAAIGLGFWAVIGFRGLTGYPQLLAMLSRVEQTRGYSTVALAAQLGLGTTAGRALEVSAAVALVAAAVALRRRPGADARIFGLLSVACLMTTPIVWLNYLTLLVPALAIVRPRLSAAWLTLLVVWLFAAPNAAVPAWKIVAWHGDLLILALLLAGARLPLARPRRMPVTAG